MAISNELPRLSPPVPFEGASSKERESIIDAILSDDNLQAIQEIFRRGMRAYYNFARDFDFLRCNREDINEALAEAQATGRPVVVNFHDEPGRTPLFDGRKIKIVSSAASREIRIANVVLCGSEKTDQPFSEGTTKRAYAAYDLLNRIKVVNVEAQIPLEKRDDIERIKKEAKIWKDLLAHSNNHRIYDIDVKETETTLTFSVLQQAGTDLYTLLLQSHGFSSEEKLKKITLHARLAIAKGMLAHLAQLHELLGIIHGDIAPKNVIIFADNECALIDFDCAERVGYSEEKELRGTPAYIAPEQAMVMLARICPLPDPPGEKFLSQQAQRYAIPLASMQDIWRPSQCSTLTSFKSKESDMYAMGITFAQLFSNNVLTPLEDPSFEEYLRTDRYFPTFHTAWRQNPENILKEPLPGVTGELLALLKEMVDRNPLVRPTAREAFDRLCHIETSMQSAAPQVPLVSAPPPPPDFPPTFWQLWPIFPRVVTVTARLPLFLRKKPPSSFLPLPPPLIRRR